MPMKIYTRTGDGGETSLLGGRRVAKDHPRVAACGDVDELNAALGAARAQADRADSEVRAGRQAGPLQGVPVAIISQKTPREANGTVPMTTMGYSRDSNRLAMTKKTQARASSMFMPISPCCCRARWISLPKFQL